MTASPSLRSLPASVELRAGSGSGIAALTEGTVSLGDLVVDVAITADGPGLRIDWTLHNPGSAAVAMDEVNIRFSELRPSRVVERGWSGASAVRSATPGEVSLPVTAGRDLADTARAGRSVIAHQVLVHDRGVVGLLDGRGQLGFIETPSPRASGPGTAVVLLLDGTELDPGASLKLAPVWLAEGDPDMLVAEFHQRWGQQAGALTGVRAPLGWWADPHLSDRAMAAGMALAGDHGLHHAVVDVTAAHIRELPAQLRAAGLRPALRLRPFALGPRGPLAARAVEQSPGRPVVIDACLVADLTDIVVLEQLRQRIADLAASGWEQFVLEGVWQGALAGRRSAGRTMTRAQALRQGLQAVRDGAGPHAVITVVDAPAGPSVGVAHRAVTGALSAVGQPAVLHRCVEHRRLWAAGPLPLDFTPPSSGPSSANPDLRRATADLAAAVGGCAWLGGDLQGYDELSWALASYLLDLGGAVDAPLSLNGATTDLPMVINPSLRGAGHPLPPLHDRRTLAASGRTSTRTAS